jgi:hypothetical protein
VSADGKGVVSHAGTALLRELASATGLVRGWNAALSDAYRLPPMHAPGQVLVDLAVTIADGGDALRHLRALRDQALLFGPVASDPTAWRVVDKVDTVRLDLLRVARGKARERAWAAGAGPDLSQELWMLFDSSLLTAHSDKEDAAPTWKKGFGFHPLLCYLDRPDVSGGEALAGLLRPGNAGSNTAADHVKVLDLAIAAVPPHARPGPATTGHGGWPAPIPPAPPTCSPPRCATAGSGSPSGSRSTRTCNRRSWRSPRPRGHRPTTPTANRAGVPGSRRSPAC